MGALIRAVDWAATPLGALETWPQPLKTSVGILLNSGYPMYIAWGDSFTQIYNDAYRPILGSTKHPAALGIGTPETFAEIWEYIGPMFRSVMSSGQASTFIDQLLPLNRHGFAEECYFVFSYSPILTEQGGVGGVFVTVLETTERVLRDRRQRTLRELMGISPHGGRDAILSTAAEVLARNAEDICFVRLFGEDEAAVAVHAAAGDPHSLERAIGEAAEARLRATDGPVDLDEPVACAPWPELVTRAVRVPILAPGAAVAAGALEIGLSPRLAWDEAYSDFIRALAANLGAHIAEAEAFEHERRRAKALAEIDAAKTVFFSNVSHEFRTPLTLMLAPIEELLARPDLVSAQGRELLEVADRNALRLLKLVNALLDFSRIEAGRVAASYQPTDLAAFTAELASNFRSAIEAAGLQLIVDCPPLDEPILVDRDMWEKIVLNLLSNAFKFTFEGHIAVRLRQAASGYVALSIEDTGAGVPQDELPRLFERFHRVEGARGRSYEGTGIGLALVQELARLHGGDVQVRSVEGAGSTFTVTIAAGSKHLLAADAVAPATEQNTNPRARAFVDEARHWASRSAPEPDGSVVTSDAGAAAGRGRRVVVADDNADMRDYIQRLLQGDGYAVEAVADGDAALAAALRAPPDLMLSDVMMPGLDGIGLLKALRDNPRTSRVPVILLSARAGEEARLEGLSAGADDYLVKPFSSRELIAKVTAAVRLEEARREAARIAEQESLRMRALFEQAPGFITILSGPEHRFEFANAAYSQLVGGRDLIGKTIREALPDVEGQGYFELLDQVYANGERFVGRESPLRLLSPGEETPREALVDFIYEPIRDAEGAVTGIFVEGYEVTERVAAQAALRQSEEQLRLATEAAEIGLWDVDNVANKLYWPPRVKAMFGVSPDAPVTMDDFYAGLHPEDRQATVAAYQAANDPAQRALYDVEYRTIGKEDGVVRWVAAKGRGIFDSEGRCVRVIGTAIDITQRKAREARLKELNEILERRMSEALAEKKLLADIVEGTDAFVQVADLDFRWLAINKASADEFERIYGVRPQPGASMLEVLADRPEHQAAVKAVWGRALAGEEFTVVAEFGDHELGRRHYEMKFNVLRDAEGRRIGAYQFVYDVTERLRDQQRLADAESALRQTQKLEAMGQLTGGVAHDFNNLLTPIVGGLEMLQRRDGLGEREQRLISGALQSAERARVLVQRLLAFARRQPLQPRPVDVGELVRGMAELVGSTTGPQIKVVVDVAEDLPPAKADANQLEMAILNLSVNARDAMETGGTLRISADLQTVERRRGARLPPGAYVRISVADTGCGMDEAVAARAIEPFFSTKGVGKGTGLGLSMVHGLASQLGGALTINSRKGVGTNVELWVPVSTEPAPPGRPEADREVARLAAGAVLLVDDEDVVRMTAADMLAEMGFNVVEANSAERALQLVDAGLTVDLLVTDHLMPGMTGVELAYAVRERLPATRVLVISGYAEAEGLAPDLSRLTKPFRPQELSAKLQELGLAVADLVRID